MIEKRNDETWAAFHERVRAIRVAVEEREVEQRAWPRCTGMCSCTSACGMKALHPGTCSCAPDSTKSGHEPEWKHGDPRAPMVGSETQGEGS